MGDTRLGQGRENAKEFLRSHPEVAASIEAQIRAAMTPATPAALDVDAASDDDTLDDEE
jgi:recombination protein RecA